MTHDQKALAARRCTTDMSKSRKLGYLIAKARMKASSSYSISCGVLGSFLSEPAPLPVIAAS